MLLSNFSQLTTKQLSKQTVMVPHYMLDKDYVHPKVQVDPFSVMQTKDHQVRTPAPKTPSTSGANTASNTTYNVQQPNIPSSLTSSQVTTFCSLSLIESLSLSLSLSFVVICEGFVLS